MEYEVKNNKIIIRNKEDFNLKHILECGQIFSYKKISENEFVVYSKDKVAKCKELESFVEVESECIDYFINFFDLNTDYSKIKNELKQKFPFLSDVIGFGYGIRILKQDPFETIISFIVSANNNIKRIQKILFAIRESYGQNMGSYYSFPTIKQMENATIDDYTRLGLGYRAKYIFNAIKQLKNVDYNVLKQKSTNDLNNFLLSISGVGQKVADCIMLFGFSKQDVFPVDTWIEKVYNKYFESEHNRKIIREKLLNTFGNLSGYAQQYLFYSQREIK